PVPGEALDAAEMERDVAQGVVVALRENALPERGERPPRGLEIARPLEQHPLDPYGPHPAEERPPLVAARQLEGAVEEFGRDAVSPDGLEEGHVGQRAREQRRLAEALRELERGGGVRLRGRDVADLVDAPGEPALDLDPCGGVV